MLRSERIVRHRAESQRGFRDEEVELSAVLVERCLPFDTCRVGKKTCDVPLMRSSPATQRPVPDDGCNLDGLHDDYSGRSG